MADHHGHVARVLAREPDMLLDNGADLIAATVAAATTRVFAATEETTSGRLRLPASWPGSIPFPVIVINDCPIKLLFESEHGIGPAAVDGFLRATNTFVAARRSRSSASARAGAASRGRCAQLGAS